ncbi:cystatin-like [Crotalus tigris]|uniref:cystatin-like n=1 Tax=Crotalus tigris TaxID=88082 RepID=UPI00192F88EB|nr:cystatin-like [Crotalus tigris]
MVHSQLPALSLLCLFCALLLLPPELTLGMPQNFTEVSKKDLKAVLTFAVPQYNQEKKDNANYFKLKGLAALMKVFTGTEYNIKLVLLKTVCKKTAGKRKTFDEIQECKELPRYPQKLTSCFKVRPSPVPNEMILKTRKCFVS